MLWRKISFRLLFAPVWLLIRCARQARAALASPARVARLHSTVHTGVRLDQPQIFGTWHLAVTEHHLRLY